jgi:hypothetical protein
MSKRLTSYPFTKASFAIYSITILHVVNKMLYEQSPNTFINILLSYQQIVFNESNRLQE